MWDTVNGKELKTVTTKNVKKFNVLSSFPFTVSRIYSKILQTYIAMKEKVKLKKIYITNIRRIKPYS